MIRSPAGEDFPERKPQLPPHTKRDSIPPQEGFYVSKGEKTYPQAPEKTLDPKMSSKMMEVVGFQNPRKTEHHKTQDHDR
jgi:hypothetical protein